MADSDSEWLLGSAEDSEWSDGSEGCGHAQKGRLHAHNKSRVSIDVGGLVALVSVVLIMFLALAADCRKFNTRAEVLAVTQVGRHHGMFLSLNEVKTQKELRAIFVIDNLEDPTCMAKQTTTIPSMNLGTAPWRAGTAEDCQDRCFQTAGCKYQAFELDTNLCHLQDAASVLLATRLIFTSGPVTCPDKVCGTCFNLLKLRKSNASTTDFHVPAISADFHVPAISAGNFSKMTSTPSFSATAVAAVLAPSTYGTGNESGSPGIPVPWATTTTISKNTAAAPQVEAVIAPAGLAPALAASIATSTQPGQDTTLTEKPPTTAADAQVIDHALLALKPAGPQPSLFCFMVLMANGYEPDLVQAQASRGVGIFACNSFMAFSTARISLNSRSETVLIHAKPSRKGKWGSWMNTKTFMSAWDAVIADGGFRSHQWVVKTDPDCVFFPERLRLRLAASVPDGPHTALYVKNCPKDIGMLGAIEIFSHQAVDLFARNKSTCYRHLHPGTSGEDGFMRYCMRLIKAESLEDFGILVDGYCGKGTCMGNSLGVAFHPYKDAHQWFRCWGQAR